MINLNETFEKQAKKFNVKQQLIALVMAEGYGPYEPEPFENYEAFAAVNERVSPSTMVKLVDNRGDILVLRPDVTTSIINELIPRFNEPGALKLFYDTNIYRMRPSESVQRTAQFGVEYLGQNGENADAKIIALIQNIFKTLGIDYALEIGNQTFLDALLQSLEDDSTRQKELKSWIMRKNRDRWQAYLKARTLDASTKPIAAALFDLEGTPAALQRALDALTLPDAMRCAAQDLLALEPLATADARIAFDLALLSEFDYYQGIVFQGYIPGQNIPVIKGGRYNPINKKTGKRLPAIGFTIDLDALVAGVMDNA